jgi:hypothetical protein
MPVEPLAITGCVAAAKKLSERRSSSRVCLPVMTEFTSTVAVAQDRGGSSAGDDLGLKLHEVPADLALHQVLGHETDVRVDRIDVLGTRHVAGDPDSRHSRGASLMVRRRQRRAPRDRQRATPGSLLIG